MKFLLGVQKIGFFSIHSLLRNGDNAGANAPDALSRFFRNDCYVSFFSHSVDKQPQWHPPPPDYLQRAVCSMVCCSAAEAEAEEEERAFPVSAAGLNSVIVPNEKPSTDLGSAAAVCMCATLFKGAAGHNALSIVSQSIS